MKLGGQLRVIPGAVIGFDMGTALEMGAALGVPRVVAAELLPIIETVAVRQMNAAAEAARGQGHG